MTIRNVALVENVIPSYRRGFYRRLSESADFRFTVFCQSHLPGWNLRLIHDELPLDVVEVPFWGNERYCVWQHLPLQRIRREFDAVVFYGNPKIISNVCAATWLRRMGRPVAIRGQLHTAGGSRVMEKIRLKWWRRFQYIIVYTDREAAQLRPTLRADQTVVGLNNGLDQRTIDDARAAWTPDALHSWQVEHEIAGKQLVLSVARVVQKNRFDLMVQALKLLQENHPNLVWCVIGDGPAKDALRQTVHDAGLDRNVRFLGATYDEGELAPWFLSSICLVHPGAIGLSLLHAFGYGLPVITHDNAANQMPEIAALRPGENGVLFRENDASELAAAVRHILEDEDYRQHLSQQAYVTATTGYNTDIMASRLCDVLQQMCATTE